jgi:intracellular multiplication protein IcmT
MAEILWRDTGIPPKIGPLDARAVFPLALWFFHWAYWTMAIALTAVVALYLVQRTGMTPLGCIRFLRVAMLGKRRETRNHESQWRRRARW